MKLYLIAFLAGLALAAVPTRALEAVEASTPEKKTEGVDTLTDHKAEEEVVVDVGEDEEIDVKTLLGDLVQYGEEEEEEGSGEGEGANEEEAEVKEGEEKKVEESERQERARNTKIVSDPQVISKYNDFVDKFLSQLSASMSESSDPLTLLVRRTGKLQEDDGSFRKKASIRKKKNSRRHPKDVSLDAEEDARQKREIADDVEENLEDYEEYEYDEEGLDIEGRALDSQYDDPAYDDDYEFEEDDDSYVDENTAVEPSREGKAIDVAEQKNKNEDARVSPEIEGRQRRPGRRRRRRRKKGGKCGKFCQRRRRRNRRRRLRNRRRGKRSVEKDYQTAVVFGASKIKRNGDVVVKDAKNGQNVIARFEVGPIVLKTEKEYNEGTAIKLRKAEAVAPHTRGKIVINFDSEGIPEIRKFRINRPKAIKVTGNLRKEGEGGSKKTMKKYIRSSRPVIAKKLKKYGIQIMDKLSGEKSI